MSNTVKYTVKAGWFNDAEVVLRVDLDALTPDLAHEINSFWSGAVDRLCDEGYDAVRAVVRGFGAKAIRYFMSNGGASLLGDHDLYWTQKVISDQGEGWPDADDLGIQIVSADVSTVGFEDVSLEAA